VITPILEVSRQFQKRVLTVPSKIAEKPVTIQDIFAISQYCIANEIKCSALREIHRSLCKRDISDYLLTDNGIYLKATWRYRETAIVWQKDDIKLLKKYFPSLLIQSSIKIVLN
jgi:hypothetical protein